MNEKKLVLVHDRGTMQLNREKARMFSSVKGLFIAMPFESMENLGPSSCKRELTSLATHVRVAD